MKLGKIIASTALGLSLVNAGEHEASAQDIIAFTNFSVSYSGAERYAPFSTRQSNTNAVVNLSNDTGTAWITANMKNSEGAYRGGTTLQRGTRKTFSAVNAQTGYQYKLGLSKTNNTGGGTVTIKGTWSASH